MPGFKAPQDRLSLVRGKVDGDFELKTVTVLKVLGPVRIALNLLCMCSLSGGAKPAWQHTCLQCEKLNISSPRSRPTAQKKRLKILPLMDSAPVAQEPMETNNEMNVFMPVPCTASILQSMDQGVISNFKSCYLRNTFHEPVATFDCDSSDGSQQSRLKTLWKGITLLDAIENIADSWEYIKMSTLTF